MTAVHGCMAGPMTAVHATAGEQCLLRWIAFRRHLPDEVQLGRNHLGQVQSELGSNCNLRNVK